MLTEALSAKYQKYEKIWSNALAAAGDAPSTQLVSLIKADFEPNVCSPESLAIWCAFWGEQNFTTEFATVTNEFDNRRADMMAVVCRNLMQNASEEESQRIAEWIDTMSDGLWLRLHVDSDLYTLEGSVDEILMLVERLIPGLKKP